MVKDRKSSGEIKSGCEGMQLSFNGLSAEEAIRHMFRVKPSGQHEDPAEDRHADQTEERVMPAGDGSDEAATA